jgi:hypothetical protein
VPIGCRLDSEVARQAGGGEEVLRRDCGVYVAGDGDEFSRVQSDEGALVFSGVVQGFSTPPLLLMIMLMTNSRKIMGNRVNTFWLNVLGWITTVAIFAASIGLVVTWFL